MMKKIALILLCSVLLLTSFGLGLRENMHRTIIPYGDLAADMLLVNKMKSEGYLLTGHYSRFGFNHPGPIFFYTNRAIEIAASKLGISRVNAWFLSSAAVNFAFLLLSVYLLTRIFPKGDLLTAFLSTALTLPIIGSYLLDTWMPYRLILPFASFYLCLLLVVLRGFAWLPVASALAGILIHGYITMPLFTIIPLALATAQRYMRRQNSSKESPIPVMLSFGILAFFALPALIDFSINTPSNLARILRASKAISSSPIASLAESYQFWVSFWAKSAAVFVPALLLYIFFYSREKEDREIQSIVTTAIAWAGLVSLLFILYHKTAPKPLFEFMGIYFIGVPIFLSAILAHVLISRIPLQKTKFAASLVAYISLLNGFAHINKIPVPGSEYIAQLGDRIISDHKQNVNIDYPAADNDLWPTAAGLLVYLQERNVNACIMRSELSNLYTPNAICKPEVTADILLVHRRSCQNDCVFNVEDFALKNMQPLP